MKSKRIIAIVLILTIAAFILVSEKILPNNTPIEIKDYHKQINSSRILEAQNHIHSVPELPNGYIDLAAAYSNS